RHVTLLQLPPVQTALKVELSTFVFLQYFIWGSWYVSMGTYLAKTLQFDGGDIGLAYGAFAIGAMISPFFVGLIADRYFASEKLLAALALLGGVTLCALPRLIEFKTFYPMLIFYCALSAPTLNLGNSLSLHHLTNASVDFHPLRVPDLHPALLLLRDDGNLSYRITMGAARWQNDARPSLGRNLSFSAAIHAKEPWLQKNDSPRHSGVGGALLPSRRQRPF